MTPCSDHGAPTLVRSMAFDAMPAAFDWVDSEAQSGARDQAGCSDFYLIRAKGNNPLRAPAPRDKQNNSATKPRRKAITRLRHVARS